MSRESVIAEFTPEEQAKFEANKIHFRTAFPHWPEEHVEFMAGWGIVCAGFAKTLGDAKDHLEATTDFRYSDLDWEE